MMRQRTVAGMLAAALATACGGSGGGGVTPPAETGTVRGTVAENAQGVAGAALQLSRAGATTRSATSSAAGEFQFPQVATGSWTLAIAAPQGYTVSGAASTTVSVAANQTTTVNFALTRDGPPAPGTTEVVMRDNVFDAADITVAAGSTVRWRNAGSVEHNSTSTAGIWASGNLAPGATFARVFGEAGTFSYACTLHAGMSGIIRVQ
jgi:plastocyanin